MDFLGFSVNSASWFAAGLCVGWFLLPAPKWVVAMWGKVFGSNDEPTA